MRVAVYCGSTTGKNEMFVRTARELGHWMGEHGCELIFGGSKTGLMGAVADGVLEAGGVVTGVVPKVAEIQQRMHPALTTLIETDSMAERKSRMIALAEAFIALPGGIGTLDEITEILSLLSLGLVKCPVIFYNVNDYYEPVRTVLSNILQNGFGKPSYFSDVVFADNLGSVARALLA